jgi:WD40 repeat protein
VAFVDRQGDVINGNRHGFVVSRGYQATALAFSRSGTLYVGSSDGLVRAYGTNRVIHVGAPVLGLSAGGERLLVRLSRSLRVYTDSGERVSTIDATAQHAVLSPGGLGAATTNGVDVYLWDASTGKLRYKLAGHKELVKDAEYSPDGGRLVTVSSDHKGLVWSALSGRLLHPLIGHFFSVNTGSFSPDGHWIVTSSQFTAGLWNARTGKLLFYLGRHAAPLTGASFSPGGNWILTGSKDGTARVYHCVICQQLPGLEATARARIHALR